MQPSQVTGTPSQRSVPEAHSITVATAPLLSWHYAHELGHILHFSLAFTQELRVAEEGFPILGSASNKPRSNARKGN